MSENYIYLDGKKIKISCETAENFRKQFVEYQFEHGDIAKNSVGGKRVIIGTKGALVSYDCCGFRQSRGQKEFVANDYKKIGSVFGE